MKWMGYSSRQTRDGVLQVAVLGATLVASGCSRGHDASAAEQVESSLAALMADGPLPSGMVAGSSSPVVPRRFCDDDTPEEDAGMAEPRDAGVVEPPVMTGGRAGSGAAPGAVPTPIPAGSGMGVAGSGMGVAGSVGPGPRPPSGSSAACAPFPIGFWRFDDCNPLRTELRDSSIQRHTAYRTVELSCAAGQHQTQAVSFTRKEDLVYTPDQPAFVLDEGLTIAAWVKPGRVDGVRTLFRKRDDGNSAFALMLNGKKFQFIVRLSSGRLATVSTPAKAGQWTHVAATYDGTLLRLYINGREASRTAAVGTIARGAGPLLMGNDASGRRFDGLLDDVWFNTLAAPESTILELTCVRQPATISVSPTLGPAVQPATPVTYQVSITNHNGPTCPPAGFGAEVSLPESFNADPSFAETTIPSGETAQVAFNISSGDETEEGTYPLFFFVFGFEMDSFASAEAEYVVAPLTGCRVISSRALTIRDVSVVDDPARTSMDGPAGDPRTGAWAFGRMMERLSPTTEDAPEVTEAMFRTFLSTQTINGFSVRSRPSMDPFVLQPWPRTADGRLDLVRSPMRLLAIVNRLDLKNLAAGKAGEGRMVYGVLDEFGNPLEFTVILEYLLPATSEEEFRLWADAFHGLQELPFPSEEYNAALQAITDRFTGRNATPSLPNGSALIDIRTNEIALSFEWELREFHISPVTGFLEPAALFQTPDSSFNFGDRLARFINANEQAILAETHEAPANFEGEPFQAGAVFNTGFDFWSAPGINNPEARHKFSLNTCNGCHGQETGTGFLQIGTRFSGEQSFLAGFQTGITVFDPETGEPRRLAELSRRRQLLESVVCADAP